MMDFLWGMYWGLSISALCCFVSDFLRLRRLRMTILRRLREIRQEDASQAYWLRRN